METSPTRMCELLVGLPDAAVLGVDDDEEGRPIRVHVETSGRRPDCPSCGVVALSKDRAPVTLIDLPAFGAGTSLVWHKRRCPARTVTAPRGVGPSKNRASPPLPWP